MYHLEKFDNYQNRKDSLIKNFSILLKTKKTYRMKKIYVFVGVSVLAMGLTYCSSSKKAAKAEAKTAAAAPKTTYTAVSTVIAGNCAPCHISGKGNKKPYDNYANVKADIDDIIHRIELNPTDKGFMPFKKTEKLPADVIAVFKKFKEDGALEN
jgi:uncharacterized membrane protein